MGIYDRDYYRGSGNRLLDPWGGTGQACRWLIGLNIVVFLLQVLTKPREMMGFGVPTMGPVTDWFILDPNLVFSGQVWRLLTYAFLHDYINIWHILFNMLFLWWFGSEVEGIYGPREFLTFYLISAVLGGLAFTAQYGFAGMDGEGRFPGHTCVGASGAVTAVMVLFACHYPFHTIRLFFFLPIPIWLFVAFQVFQDAVVFLGAQHTGVAVSVHLAGALFGFLYYKFQWRVSPFWTNLNFKPRRRAKPRLRVYYGDVEKEAITPIARAPVNEQMEAKLDAVLEKIKSFGKESLNDAERQILQQASEIYRKRREEV